MLPEEVIEDAIWDESIGFDSQKGPVPFTWELTPEKPKLSSHFCAEEEQNLSGDLSRSIHILGDEPHVSLAACHGEAGSEASFRCRISAAVPFKWEEQPGISKFPMHHEESSPCPLKLPPSRQIPFQSPHANGSRHAAPNKLKHYLSAKFSAALKQPDCASDASANSSSEDTDHITRQASSYDLRPQRDNSATRASVSGPSSLANCLLNVTSIKESSLNCHGSHPARAISQKSRSGKTYRNNSRDRRSTASHAIQHLSHEYMDRKPELQHTVAARNVDTFVRQATWSSESYEQKLYCPGPMAAYLAFEESLSSDSRSTDSSSYGRSSEIGCSGDSSDSSSQRRMEEPQSNPRFGSSSSLASRSYQWHKKACSSATCGDTRMGKCRGSPRLSKSSAAQESPESPWSSSLEKPIPMARRSFLRSVVPFCIPIFRNLD